MNSGTLPASRGGTGTTFFTTNAVVLGNGSSGIYTNSEFTYDGFSCGI